MHPKTEITLLREFLKIIDQPGTAERKFQRLAGGAFLASLLTLFFCLSDNIHPLEHRWLHSFLLFAAGSCFGLALWFLQAGTQTGVMLRHMSARSIRERLEDLGAG